MQTSGLVKAYLVHSKPYRETSLLIDFFTQEHGVIKAIAKAVRGTNKNNKRGLLQPFTPLLIDWRGSSDLVFLRNIDLYDTPLSLKRGSLVIGLYINEVIYKLLRNHTGMVMSELYFYYDQVLRFIAKNSDTHSVEVKLREFELLLLQSIGYGLQFDSISNENYYTYDFEQGFCQISNSSLKGFLGQYLLGIKEHKWDDKDVMRTAKVLLRNIILYHTGSKELNSRKLWVI